MAPVIDPDRGLIVWARLDPTEGHEQAGHRPVLVLSDRRFNLRSGTAVVMPLTSRPQKVGPPFALPIVCQGLEAFVKPGQIRVLSTARFGKRIEMSGAEMVERCLDALLQICGRRS